MSTFMLTLEITVQHVSHFPSLTIQEWRGNGSYFQWPSSNVGYIANFKGFHSEGHHFSSSTPRHRGWVAMVFFPGRDSRPGFHFRPGKWIPAGENPLIKTIVKTWWIIKLNVLNKNVFQIDQMRINELKIHCRNYKHQCELNPFFAKGCGSRIFC